MGAEAKPAAQARARSPAVTSTVRGVAPSTKYTLATSGTKAADAVGMPGPWSLEREYIIQLPAGYDSSRHYPLVLEAASCAMTAGSVYQLPDLADFIHVGLTAPQLSASGAAPPSVWVASTRTRETTPSRVAFYEALLDKLKTPGLLRSVAGGSPRATIVVGASRTSSAANTQATRMVAQFAASPLTSGGLPTAPAAQATSCSSAPLPGIWTWRIDDAERDLPAIKAAIKRGHGRERLHAGYGLRHGFFRAILRHPITLATRACACWVAPRRLRS